jgi:hypothetical protein
MWTSVETDKENVAGSKLYGPLMTARTARASGNALAPNAFY